MGSKGKIRGWNQGTFMINLFEYYEGKRVLIAGASGMTGHNLLDMMEQLCCKEVVGTCLSHQKIDEYGKERFVPVNFTNKEITKKFFEYYGTFDYVFICCAKTYNAMKCKDDPTSMTLPNIEMASNILENCYRTGVKKVLFISSSTVYQPSFKCLSEEDLDLNKDPNSLYMGVGWAKRYIEQLCKFYSNLGLETIVVRPTNIYGRYDKLDEKLNHVIPALINRALDKQDPFIIYGNGMAVKDFIHAGDFARDLAKVMVLVPGYDVINLCSRSLYTIKELAQAIFHATGHHPSKVIFTSKQQDQVPCRAISRNKFDALCGDDTYKSLQEGIKDTVEWLSLSRQTQKN